MSDRPSIDIQTSRDIDQRTSQQLSYKHEDVHSAGEKYKNLGNVARSIAEGNFATDVKGVVVHENKDRCPSVAIGRGDLDVETQAELIDRGRVIEHMRSIDAPNMSGNIGETQYLLREHLASVSVDQADQPSMREIMAQMGAEYIPDEFAVINLHGWVSGDKVEAQVDQEKIAARTPLTQATRVDRKTYFSELNGHYPADMPVFSIEPIGNSARTDTDGNPYTPNEEIPYMRIDNYTLALQDSLRYYAEQLAKKARESGKQPTAKVVVTGHSWGGRAAALLPEEFIMEMHQQGIDIVTYLMEPAFAMQPGFKAAEVAVNVIKPLVTGVNEPKGAIVGKIKQGVEAIRDAATRAVIDKAGNKMGLEPGDPMMQAVHKTSLPATVLPLADLAAHPIPDEEITRIIQQPWVGLVELSAKDALVDNRNMASLPKTYEVADRGHIAQRDQRAGMMQAHAVYALFAHDQYRAIDHESRVLEIRNKLADQEPVPA